MRSTKDRIRHALGFEIIGLLIFTPLATLVFGYELHSMGVIAIGASITATLWNYLYNILFDRALLKVRGSVQKTLPIRVLHALLFEGGLLILFMPFIAWYLGITLWQAFLMDIAMTVFYVVYGFFYNLAYDKVYPVATSR